jgi:putative flippase GtrA
MLVSTRLATSYAIFALIATATNIGAQDMTVRAYSGAFHVLVSVIVGTGVGLVVKYILDKRYIFRFRARSVAHDTRTFALYTVMGLITTLGFWGIEFGFNYVFET